jgi:hypothetical protein
MVSSLQSPEIPVSSLVAYANEQEGGNWRGTSWLRALYRHWRRKDRLLRVDAINNERNGAGVPIAYAPPGASDQVIADLGALARSYRAGEAAGGGLPNGADLRFRGVEGTLPNILDSIRYDDEQMAARVFALAQEAIAKQYADVTNEHVIEDLVDINFSIDENAPLLKFDTETDKRYSVADLKLLIDAGALTPYPELEEYLRSEGDLPKPKDPEDQPEDQADDEGDEEPTPLRPAARTRIKAAMTVGGRTLRRNPLPHELKAAVDWDAMEEAWSSQQTSLVDQWKTEVNTAHADTLVEAIEAAETLDQLAALEAPVLGEQLMSDAMFALAEIAGRGCR